MAFTSSIILATAASASARVAVFAGVEYDALHPFKPFYYALYAVVVPGTALDVIEAEAEINAQRVAAVKVYPIVGTDYVVLGLAHFGSVGTEYGALMHERQKRFVKIEVAHIPKRFGEKPRVQQVHAGVLSAADIFVYG